MALMYGAMLALVFFTGMSHGWLEQMEDDSYQMYQLEKQSARALQQMHQNYWDNQIGALQRQMFEYPQTLEESMHNYELEKQVAKVIQLADADFIFGLRPVFKGDGTIPSSTVASGAGFGAGAGAAAGAGAGAVTSVPSGTPTIPPP